MALRYLGFDAGAETARVAEVLVHQDGTMEVAESWSLLHRKNPRQAFRDLYQMARGSECHGMAATGRLAPSLNVPSVPLKSAVAEGFRLMFPDTGASSVVGIGSNGFWVVDALQEGIVRLRENSRCSQGTGNFLTQLVERFNLSLQEADAMSAVVEEPAPLSGRCPVILKTDMTHLANRGEDRDRILAGLYDAVCENVQALLKSNGRVENLVLVGGVTRAPRIQTHFRNFAGRNGLNFIEPDERQRLLLEAYGAAVLASRQQVVAQDVDSLWVERKGLVLEKIPGLSQSLSRVTRMQEFLPSPPDGRSGDQAAVEAGGPVPREGVVGFDIGSTGSKAVLLDPEDGSVVWHSYLNTLGDPVGAARELVYRLLQDARFSSVAIRGVGVTGSGREIVGTLMESLYGGDQVFVCNEIAAHARGALHFDPEVDTIFEIGGQDAKYIRLDNGQIFDAAMNEACSAGTGSFIEEQGRKFDGIESVVALGKEALASPFGVSLGQHCSVFMAEVIDQAVSAGIPNGAIVAGIYDSVVQNYLNRVKGTRSVGKKIFCQGMPFSADALAAAVVSRTGREVIVPPNPGTIGAMGIALLASDEFARVEGRPLPLSRFLHARVVSRDTFVCRSTKGCGGSGNSCRIDRLVTDVEGAESRFLWGGGCSLYDKGTRRRKLPVGTPDPFCRREDLVGEIIGACSSPGRPVVAMTDEFMLKETIPFFATFIHLLGYDVRVYRDGGRDCLKEGIDAAVVPYCAPLQLYHGLVQQMVHDSPDYLFLPMVRELPRGREPHSVTCPMVQASPNLLRDRFETKGSETRFLAPVINMGHDNLNSRDFRNSCRQLAMELGSGNGGSKWEVAWSRAVEVQERFEQRLSYIGREALEFARLHGIVPVVVFGRTYTIYNSVLNSNVPALLREQGALAIPVDAYPIEEGCPSFSRMYWYHGQKNLRAAHQLRRTGGLYGVFCSNYSCGPDSFSLSFYSYIMENKPFAIIETDGHSGDAGTRTRLEAFLYCVEGDRKKAAAIASGEERGDDTGRLLNSFDVLERREMDLPRTRERGDLILIPRMGIGAEVAAALLRGSGMRAEVLPLPDRDGLALGRRYTTGKECIPMTITLGSLLQRLEREDNREETFAFFMPTANGPCRFGTYSQLHKIVLEKTGWKDRVHLVSQPDSNYFEGLAADFQIRAWIGFVAADLLEMALHDVRPAELVPGGAERIFKRYYQELLDTMERVPSKGMVMALREIPGGMYGVKSILRRAAVEFRAMRDDSLDLPVISVVGEIYARLDPFANGRVIEHLERAGARVRLAPFSEWLEYTSWGRKKKHLDGRRSNGDTTAEVMLSVTLQTQIVELLYSNMARVMGWAPRTTVEDSLHNGGQYISRELMGEAILTLGAALHEFRHGEADGAVVVGPLECMPNKIAEAHLNRADWDYGLPSLTIYLNGEPVDPRVIEDFVFEVKERRSASPKRRNGSNGVPFQVMGKAASRILLNAALRLLPPVNGGRSRSQVSPPPRRQS